MSPRKICLLLFVLVSAPLFCERSFAQSTSVINGVLHTTTISVAIDGDAVGITRDDTISVSAIKPEHSTLREYLSSFGSVVLKKVFPGSMWGDTILMNPQGRPVKTPNTGEYYQILFPNPVPARKTLQKLRSFPEVKDARLTAIEDAPH